MKKKWILGGAALLLLSGLGTACGSKLDAGQQVTTVSTKSDTAGEIKAGAKPGLDAKLTQEGRNATITYTVSNMHISGDHMDHAAVAGEGHLHLYVDGKEKAKLKTSSPVKLENLSAGKHAIKLSLQNNDHTDVNVEKVFDIVVK
jgi:hypothetical protein